MKTIKYLTTALAAFLATATLPAQIYQTNLVQTLSFNLSGVAQGTTTTNGNDVITTAGTINLGSRAIIKAIGAAIGDSFSPAATLDLVTSLSGPGTPYVVVQDGTNTVSVADFLSISPLSGTVETSVLNQKTSRFVGSDYVIEQFVLQDGYAPLNLHFNVSGLAVENIVTNGGTVEADNSTAQVAGSGDRNGTPVIFQGEVDVHGHQIQIITINDGGF